MSASKTQRKNGAGAKKATKSKPSKKRSIAGSGRDRAKKELTADEQLIRAWQKTYENQRPS